jgi:type II secretory pathway component PulF
MPRFKYDAVDNKGKSTTGEVIAADPRQAMVKIRELGIFPTQVGEVVQTPQQGLRRRISSADVAQLVRQLANLNAGGLPVHRSLVVLSEQTDSPALRAMLDDAKNEVRAGGSLSVALAKFPREFSPLAINMIRTGESTGTLDQSLTRLSDLMEKTVQRRSQIISALIYPALLICVAIAAVVFLMTFLVPKLGATFKDMQTELPLPTRALIACSTAVQSYWWLIIPILAAVGVWIFMMYKREGAGWFELVIARVPVARRVFERVVAARVARTLGTMLSGGVGILETIEIASTGSGSSRIGRKLEAVREQVREGVTLATALNNTGGFLPAIVHVSAVGEETGKLPELLLRLADSLDFDVDIAMRRFVSILEPVIIIVMGLMVGFIVLAMLLPIFSISQVVK